MLLLDFCKRILKCKKIDLERDFKRQQTEAIETDRAVITASLESALEREHAAHPEMSVSQLSEMRKLCRRAREAGVPISPEASSWALQRTGNIDSALLLARVQPAARQVLRALREPARLQEFDYSAISATQVRDVKSTLKGRRKAAAHDGRACSDASLGSFHASAR
eukprot:6538007-Prymnesium_polylepis.1